MLKINHILSMALTIIIPPPEVSSLNVPHTPSTLDDKEDLQFFPEIIATSWQVNQPLSSCHFF